jgi:hypothetical protein
MEPSELQSEICMECFAGPIGACWCRPSHEPHPLEKTVGAQHGRAPGSPEGHSRRRAPARTGDVVHGIQD